MTSDDLGWHILGRLREVQSALGGGGEIGLETRFADAVDSMGLAEFVGLIADDCGVEPAVVEEAVGGRFTTIADMIKALCGHGIVPGSTSLAASILPAPIDPPGETWLVAVSAHLPDQRVTATRLDELLGRPEGWFERRAGISACCRWGSEDPLDAAVGSARDCFHQAGMTADDVGALLVTSEAPPQGFGLAAALHARLALPAGCPALEVGGACVGFLHGVWLGQRLVRRNRGVLVVAVEAPSRWLRVQPGPAGEAAALFGDAAAACLICAEANGVNARPIVEVTLGCDGSVAGLVEAGLDDERRVEVRLRGPALASRAVHALTACVREITARHGLEVAELGAVVAHAGNGRMAPLLARRLDLQADRLLSTTAQTGNLGSASLPAAWAERGSNGPAVWATVGAGLRWGALLLGPTVWVAT